VGQRAAAEFVGTCLLLFTIVGSGIVVQDLGSDAALQLLAQAIAVGAVLSVLIGVFGPVSGGHLNPVVTLVFWHSRELTWRNAVVYVLAQATGALSGVVLAHATFARALLSISTTVRDGFGRVLAEVISTFVLVLLVCGLTRTNRSHLIPWAVGVWVTTAIFATSSTGFANPAVTLARSLTDTYSGIAPINVGGFIVGQVSGGLLAISATSFFFPVHSARRKPRHRGSLRRPAGRGDRRCKEPRQETLV